MIVLPMPPSTNNLFKNAGHKGRMRSDEYNAWIQLAGLKLNRQKPIHMSGDIEIVLRVPKKMRGDLDNRIKAPLDLLVKHGVIEDDRFVQGIYISRHNCDEMEVEIIQA